MEKEAQAPSAPDTLQTNQAKQFVTGEIGQGIDARLTDTKDRIQQNIGAGKAFRRASDLILVMKNHTAQDFKDLESELRKATDPALVHAFVNKYIDRCSEAMLNMSVKAKTDELQAMGAVPELTEAIKLVQNYHSAATVRIGQFRLQTEQESGSKNGKSNGVRRPGDGSARRDLQARIVAENGKKKPVKKARKAKKARKRKK